MEQRRLLIALVLSFLIIFAWDRLYMAPRRPKPQPVATTTTTQPEKVQAAGTAASAAAASMPATPSTVPLQTQTFTTSLGEVTISNEATFFSEWKLNSYTAKPGDLVSLNDVLMKDTAGELAFDSSELAYLSRVRGQLEKKSDGWVWSYRDANVQLTRQYIVRSNEPTVQVRLEAKFPGPVKPKFMFVGLSGSSSSDDTEAQDRKFAYWTNEELKSNAIEESITLREVPTPIRWMAAENRYFLFGWVNGVQGQEPKGLIQPTQSYQGRMSFVYPVSGDTVSAEIKTFLAPKRLEVLRSIEPTLENVVDFGWFTFFAYPLLSIMKWIESWARNWGVAIILLTLFVKLVTFPLTYKSMKSMKQMASLQPELQRLRDRYKDDKEALNREMLTMMRSKGYNPMAGCLPILVQMPVFFALYRVLYSSIELYQAPFFAWIQDLSAKDPYFVTPILVTATMFFQQKLTPNTATDPVQQKMIQWMPVIFGAFMLTLPSGLGIYMLVNALASILQQLVLNKKLDIRPHGTPSKIGA
jgi:YidC/Oxa1 family membrane protein insertase